METVRSPERRIEDIEAILKGCHELKGMTSFGYSKVSYFEGKYQIDIPSEKPGMGIYFVLDARGVILDSGRFFEEERTDEVPLTASEIADLREPIQQEDKMLNEAIGTFIEEGGIRQGDKEIAIREESEKVAMAVRTKVVEIEKLTADFCKKNSDELRIEPSEVAPSVVASFEEKEWKAVILKVRKELQEEGFRQAA